MDSIPKIAIIGAGPAGLTLARLLHVSKIKIEVTVYELDTSPTSRVGQGGTLDLHADTGLAAIRKCGLWDSFLKYARYDGDEKIMADKNATILVHAGGGEKGSFDRPEIDRYKLREILLNSVPQEYVRWGWHLREVTEDGMLKFDGKEKMEGPFDLIVGADGAWSKVRNRLTDVKPQYSGISGYEMDILEPALKCPHVNKMVGKGGFFGNSDSKFLNAQRMGNGSLKVRSWYRCPEGEANETLDTDGKEGCLEKLLKRYDTWAPEMTELLRQGDLHTLIAYTIYELPVGTKWDHKKGFTLVGDASSLAAPFSGEGVNKAMTDSLELAEVIEKSQESVENITLDQAVLRYEQGLFPRSRDIQEITMSSKKNAFGPGAPIAIFTGLLKDMTSKSSSIFIRMLGTFPFVATVFSYFWIRIQVGWVVRRLWRRT
jgi:2-polyprenyl-6-methoxyphenol hydroxylase-like FAD-dependent oxidoreductase